MIILGTGAQHLSVSGLKLEVDKLPDGEIRVRLPKVGKKTVLIQSFYGDPNARILETIFAAKTARELGAKKLYLVALYFPYLRQDKRFRKYEAVSSRIVAELFRVFDWVFIFEPHLHRYRHLQEFFPNAIRISLVDLVRFRDFDAVVGPDEESRQWAEPIARSMNVPCYILRKKRISPEKVEMKLPVKKVPRRILIVDDMVSTGGTMIEAYKLLRKAGAKRITFFAFHGPLTKKGERIAKYGEVYFTNTVPSKHARFKVEPKIKEVIDSIKYWDQKRLVAKAALKFVKDGMKVGVGCGSTATQFLVELGKSGKRVKVILACEDMEGIAKAYGLRVIKKGIPDVAVDGADVVSEQLYLLKGKGALAISAEKELDYKARRLIIIVDERKLKRELKGEVIVEAEKEVDLSGFGKVTKVVKKGDRLFYFLEARIKNPEEMEKRLNEVPGVVENGIFTRRDLTLIYARGNEVCYKSL